MMMIGLSKRSIIIIVQVSTLAPAAILPKIQNNLQRNHEQLMFTKTQTHTDPKAVSCTIVQGMYYSQPSKNVLDLL